MSALDTLIAELRAGKYSDDPQTVIAVIDDMIAALSGLQTPNLFQSNGAAVIVPPNATTQFTMAGLAGAITPKGSGVVRLDIWGTIVCTVASGNDGITYQLAFGTGAAPASNAAASGTLLGSIGKFIQPSNALGAGNIQIPFSVSSYISGLAQNVAIWFDLQQKAIVAANVMGFSNVCLLAREL